MCMYVCIYVYMYVYIHMYIRISLSLSVSVTMPCPRGPQHAQVPQCMLDVMYTSIYISMLVLVY